MNCFLLSRCIFISRHSHSCSYVQLWVWLQKPGAKNVVKRIDDPLQVEIQVKFESEFQKRKRKFSMENASLSSVFSALFVVLHAYNRLLWRKCYHFLWKYYSIWKHKCHLSNYVKYGLSNCSFSYSILHFISLWNDFKEGCAS